MDSETCRETKDKQPPSSSSEEEGCVTPNNMNEQDQDLQSGICIESHSQNQQTSTFIARVREETSPEGIFSEGADSETFQETKGQEQPSSSEGHVASNNKSEQAHLQNGICNESHSQNQYASTFSAREREEPSAEDIEGMVTEAYKQAQDQEQSSAPDEGRGKSNYMNEQAQYRQKDGCHSENQCESMFSAREREETLSGDLFSEARLEFEILSEGLTEATLWNKCHENSGHTGFFLASEFTSASLPDEYRSDATYSECIHLMSELTVKLRINHTSCSRPDDDPVSKYRSILGVTRTCTGFLSYYNLRDWASLFETFCILKQNPKLDNNDVQRQDNFFQNDIEFDLKRVRDHVKKKMNVFQLSEQDVDQIGNECLRELCLQAWAAVQAYSRNASLELFEKMLLHNVALCVFAGVEDLNDMLDIPQDILENMPQSVVNDCDDDNLEKEVSQEDMLHQRDLSNKSSLDSIDDILGYPTKNSTDNSTNNISDDTTNNRSDDVTNSKPDNSTNNRSDDEINSKADNSTNNRTDDQTNDTSVFLIKNSSTDSVNNIVNDTTYNESVSSTNVLGDVRKVQSVDPIKSMSNETKNNSLEDPGKSRLVCSTIRDYYNQANMLAHSTNASSSDSDSNISDDGTKDGWDDAVMDTLNDPKDDNLGSDVEESEHSLMSILPCSCPECLRSGCPEKAGYLFSVVTDRRAIFDKEEATRTVVDIVWGEQVIHLYGQTPEEVSENSDLKYLVCVTHELDVARKIRKLCTQFEKVYKNMPAKREGLLAVICSYPHGFSKMISIGEWTARYLHPCGQNPPMTYVSYQYTTPTCPGSIGAPVLVLGQKSNMQQIRSEIQCHYGKLSGHLNRSGIGFGFDYS